MSTSRYARHALAPPVRARSGLRQRRPREQSPFEREPHVPGSIRSPACWCRERGRMTPGCDASLQSVRNLRRRRPRRPIPRTLEYRKPIDASKQSTVRRSDAPVRSHRRFPSGASPPSAVNREGGWRVLASRQGASWCEPRRAPSRAWRDWLGSVRRNLAVGDGGHVAQRRASVSRRRPSSSIPTAVV
jgi:hypothetical protein